MAVTEMDYLSGGGEFKVDNTQTIPNGSTTTIPISGDCMFACMSSAFSAFAFGSIINGVLTKYNENYTTISYSNGNLNITNNVGASLTAYIAHN